MRSSCCSNNNPVKKEQQDVLRTDQEEPTHNLLVTMCAYAQCMLPVGQHSYPGRRWRRMGTYRLCWVPHIVTRPLRKVKGCAKQKICLIPSNSCLYTIVRSNIPYYTCNTPDLSAQSATLTSPLTVLAVCSLLIITPISLERNKRV